MMLPRWYHPPALRGFNGRQVIARIALLHDVTLDDITGPSRMAHICAARRHAMRELRARGLSTPRIGQLLNRDHSTVVYGLRRLAG